MDTTEICYREAGEVIFQSAGEAETFWGGCGAIRRQVFLEAGRYDEWSYPRPQIEDVERLVFAERAGPKKKSSLPARPGRTSLAVFSSSWRAASYTQIAAE